MNSQNSSISYEMPTAIDQLNGNSQIDGESGRTEGGEEAVGLVGLLYDGFDIADLRHRFQNLLLLVSVILAFLLRLLHHLIVVLHKSAAEAAFLSLGHAATPPLSLCAVFSKKQSENAICGEERRWDCRAEVDVVGVNIGEP